MSPSIYRQIARAGATPGVTRYVLIAGLLLVVVIFAVILLV